MTDRGRAPAPPPSPAPPLHVGTTTANLLAGSGGDAIVSNFAAVTTAPDAVSSMSNVAGDLSGGGIPSVLLSTAAPGDTYLATGLFGIAAAAIAVGTG